MDRRTLAVKVERKRSTESIASSADVSSPLFRLNLILAVLALAAFSGYVFLSNFLVSQRYALGMRKQQFSQTSTALSSETANGSDVSDMKALLLFAQTSGLVEAKDAGIILEENEIVLSKTEAVSPAR